MEDDCVTVWRWPQKTAPAASAHRVGNSNNNEKLISNITVSPLVFGDYVIMDLLFIIFGSVGYIMIIITIMLITSTLIHLHYSALI